MSKRQGRKNQMDNLNYSSSNNSNKIQLFITKPLLILSIQIISYNPLQDSKCKLTLTYKILSSNNSNNNQHQYSNNHYHNQVNKESRH